MAKSPSHIRDGSVPPGQSFLSGRRAHCHRDLGRTGHRNIPQGATPLEPVRADCGKKPSSTGLAAEMSSTWSRRAATNGWPVITYGIELYDGRKIGEGITTKAGLEQPIYYWDPVIAPSGIVLLRRRHVSRMERQSIYREPARHEARSARVAEGRQGGWRGVVVARPPSARP